MSNLNHRLNTTAAIKGCPTNSVLHTSFETEPDHLMPFGPAVIGHPYQPVLQSAAAAASSLRHVAVPRGDTFTSIHLSSEEEVSLDKRTKISASSLSATCPK